MRLPPGIDAALAAAVSLLALAGCARAQEGEARDTGTPEPVIGLPCEGCEAVFEGRPKGPGSTSRIAPEDEPGEPMRIEGIVHDPEGRPAPGVIVYAYHTDARGVYPRDERLRGSAAYRHGRLRGWVETDERGRYRFDTIRPASYPDRETPAHVHMHVIEPACCTYYIDSIHFADDPRLSAEERDRLGEGRGGSGLVRPRRDERGVWVVRRDIVLGERVPGHPGEAGRDDRSIADHVTVPADVHALLRRACYDCHSGETRWPWYSRVAPVSWWIARDVRHGRSNLDFSRWSTDPDREPTPAQRLRWTCRDIREGAMPPRAYRLVHPEARLTDEEKDAVCAWTRKALRDLVPGW